MTASHLALTLRIAAIRGVTQAAALIGGGK